MRYFSAMTSPGRLPIRLLVFGASLRAASLNMRLAQLAAETIRAGEADVDLATMRDFDCPSYDADVEQAHVIPAGAEEFHRRLSTCHGFVICSPEYNASMPGVLKNLIDWVSRFRPQPFATRYGLVMSASPSMSGGNRGLWALRMPLEHLGARVYPEMFSLARAHEAFDDGHLVNPDLQHRFNATITGFLD